MLPRDGQLQSLHCVPPASREQRCSFRPLAQFGLTLPNRPNAGTATFSSTAASWCFAIRLILILIIYLCAAAGGTGATGEAAATRPSADVDAPRCLRQPPLLAAPAADAPHGRCRCRFAAPQQQGLRSAERGASCGGCVAAAATAQPRHDYRAVGVQAPSRQHKRWSFPVGDFRPSTPCGRARMLSLPGCYAHFLLAAFLGGAQRPACVSVLAR